MKKINVVRFIMFIVMWRAKDDREFLNESINYDEETLNEQV